MNIHCDEVFCSRECLLAGIRSGHLLECGCGNIDTILELMNSPIDILLSKKFDDRECAYACSEFRRHSIASDEFYLVARRVIITLVTPHLLNTAVDMESESAVRATLNSFLCHFPPLAPCPAFPLASPDQHDTDGSIEESWLLLTSSFLRMGADRSWLRPLLSYSFYHHLVKSLLPRHVRHLKCDGSDGANPLQRRLLQACRDNEYETAGGQGDGDGAGGRSADYEEVLTVSRELFPSTFPPTPSQSSPTPPPPTECPALSIMASVAPAAAVDDDGGGSAVEACSCIGLVLLPHCSRYAVHSCLPSAHFHHHSSSSSGGEGGGGAGHSTKVHNSLPPHGGGEVWLPSSSSLIVSVESERDWVCTCPPEERAPPSLPSSSPSCWWRGPCTCSGRCEDGLSVSLLPDGGGDLSSRGAHLNRLLCTAEGGGMSDGRKHPCGCFRCRVEGGGSLSEGVASCNMRTALSLGYLYMQTQHLSRARQVFEALLHRLETEPCHGMSTLREELHHALGGAYLSEGESHTQLR